MFKGIQTKFLIPILLLQFIALSVLGYLGYRFSSNILRTKAEKQFESIIDSSYATLEEALSKRVSSIQNLLKDQIFIKFQAAPHYKSDVDVAVYNFQRGNGLLLGEPQIGGLVNFPIGLLANEGGKAIINQGLFPTEEYIGSDGIVKQHVYLGGSNDVDFETKDFSKLDRSQTEWFRAAMAGNIYIGKPQPMPVYMRTYEPININYEEVVDLEDLVPIAIPHKIGDKIMGVLLVTTTADFITNALPKGNIADLFLLVDQDERVIAELGTSSIRHSMDMPDVNYLRDHSGSRIETVDKNLIMHKTSPTAGWSIIMFGTKASIYGEVYKLRDAIDITMILSMFVMGVSVFFIIRRLISPILKLTKASDRIAAGELGVVINKESNDEIGKLADSFNHMSLATKDMHDKLELQNIRLSRMNFVRRQMLSIISHELKTPLNHVVNFYDLTNEELNSTLTCAGNSELIDCFNRLGISIERCKNLVERLTKATSAMAGEIRSDDEVIESCDLGLAVSTVIDGIREHTDERHIKIQRSLPENCQVQCPASALKLIIEEALSNAVKYSPDNSTIEVSGKIAGIKAIIDITDHGIGMSKTYLEDVIEPFFEIQDTDKHFTDKYKQGAGGLGLGLTIIMSLVKRYHGDLEINSEEGSGTSLVIEMPG